MPDFKNPQALNRYAYSFNNPIKYVDPSGHAPICGRDCQPEETNPFNPPPPPEQPPSETSKPSTLDAMGVRLDASVGYIVAYDIDLDFVMNFPELVADEKGVKFEGGEFDVFIAPIGLQIFDMGGGVSGGLLFFFNLPENERYEGWGWDAGGDVYPGVGGEVEVFGAITDQDYPEGTPWGIYAGAGAGSGFHLGIGGEYTWDIAKIIKGSVEP